LTGFTGSFGFLFFVSASASQALNTERFSDNDSNSPQAIALHHFHPGSDEKTCKILIILSSLKIKIESIPRHNFEL